MARVNIELRHGDSRLNLPFIPLEHSGAQKWLHCLRKAGPLRERRRFNNFISNPEKEKEQLTRRLNRCLEQLQLLEPKLEQQRISIESWQRDINHLHVHFADSHLLDQSLSRQNYGLLKEFNNLMHQAEAWHRNQERPSDKLPEASFTFTFQHTPILPLDPTDCEAFTIRKEFGMAYANYCQVGRHIYEMFLAQDEIVEDEHILPLKQVKGDSYVWLGPSTGEEGYRKKSEALKTWFFRHKERFARLGLYWGDPALAIGWLPVAKLDMDAFDGLPPQAIVEKVSNHLKVESVTVDEA